MSACQHTLLVLLLLLPLLTVCPITQLLSWLLLHRSLLGMRCWSGGRRYPCKPPQPATTQLAGHQLQHWHTEENMCCVCRPIHPLRQSSVDTLPHMLLSMPSRRLAVTTQACAMQHCLPDEWLACKLWLVKLAGRREHQRVGGQLAAQLAVV